MKMSGYSPPSLLSEKCDWWGWEVGKGGQRQLEFLERFKIRL